MDLGKAEFASPKRFPWHARLRRIQRASAGAPAHPRKNNPSAANAPSATLALRPDHMAAAAAGQQSPLNVTELNPRQNAEGVNQKIRPPGAGGNDQRGAASVREYPKAVLEAAMVRPDNNLKASEILNRDHAARLRPEIRKLPLGDLNNARGEMPMHQAAAANRDDKNRGGDRENDKANHNKDQAAKKNEPKAKDPGQANSDRLPPAPEKPGHFRADERH